MSVTVLWKSQPFNLFSTLMGVSNLDIYMVTTTKKKRLWGIVGTWGSVGVHMFRIHVLVYAHMLYIYRHQWTFGTVICITRGDVQGEYRSSGLLRLGVWPALFLWTDHHITGGASGNIIAGQTLRHHTSMNIFQVICGIYTCIRLSEGSTTG